MQDLMSVKTGSLDEYIHSVNAIPMLSLEEEQKLTSDWFIEKDTNAAKRLVMSHLRLVVSLSRKYFGYGLSQADIIQEGNIGLMKAVKKFNPNYNVRLVTYATHWIKAEIHDYILKNWRMVKIATTKSQRKLFFKLRSLLPADSHLTNEHLNKIAIQLEVKKQDIIDMQARLIQSDASLDEAYEDGENHIVNTLSDERYEPSQNLADKQLLIKKEKVTQAIENLKQKDERMYHIIQNRWLNITEEKVPFREFALKWQISIERVSQLEKQAIKYIKQYVHN